MLLHVLQPSSTQSPWSRDWRRSRCKCSGERSRAFADLRATSSFGVRGLATIANSLSRCFPAFLVVQKDINMQHAISRVPFVEPVSCWTNTPGGRWKAYTMHESYSHIVLDNMHESCRKWLHEARDHSIPLFLSKPSNLYYLSNLYYHILSI